jgi:capsid protein
MVGVRKRTHTSSDTIIGAELEDDEEPPEFGYSSEKLTPGAILELEPGEDFSFSSPPSSGGLADYLRIGLQAIASGYRVMYDQLSQDLSQTSYSGFKAGRMDFYADVDATREHVIYPELEKLVRRFMSVYEANTGEDLSDLDFSFVAPAREQLEPVKETNAMREQRKLGLKSFADVALAAGHDPDEQAARLAQDYVVLARHGLTLDPATGAVVPATPPATQDNPEPDPEQ